MNWFVSKDKKLVIDISLIKGAYCIENNDATTKDGLLYAYYVQLIGDSKPTKIADGHYLELVEYLASQNK